MKIVYSDRKTGKTSQMEVEKDKAASLIGKKMGEVIDGYPAGLDGFKLKITGLNDSTGAPSRMEIDGTRKAWPLIGSGPGIRNRIGKGYRAKRMVRGNTIGTDTEQVNTVIEEYGAKPIDEVFKPKEKKE
jgi:small subunit ribosomal protein S6e